MNNFFFKCGKTGHITKECRSGYGGGGREYSDRGFNGKCNNCDKQDHKSLTTGSLKKTRIKDLTDIRLIYKLMQR